MPYITYEQKEALDDRERRPVNAGELNYSITRVIQSYWVNSTKNYQALNDISGAMTEALAEFRRRVIVPYEQEKAYENGDIY